MIKKPTISPRLAELGEKQLAGTLTPDEAVELDRLKRTKAGSSRPCPTYSEALGERICARLAEGSSLRQAASAEGVPFKTVDEWQAIPHFAAHYARATETRLKAQEEMLLEIEAEMAEAASDKKNGNRRLLALKYRHDAIKWRLSKLMPKQYGERQAVELTGKEGAPLIPAPTDDALRRLAVMQAEAAAELAERRRET